MILREFCASRATRDLVRVYRIAHFALAGVQTAPVKVFTPRPEPCLYFFVRENEVVEYPGGRRFQSECVIAGMHDITIRRFVPKDFLLLTVAFEPGALHRLTGIPLTALHNQCLDAEGVLGAEVRRINGRLQDASTYSEMIAIADEYIARLAACRRASKDLDAPLRLLRDTPAISIDWLADQSSLSLRQFERCCRDQTGMRPKAFARLARFDRAFYTKLIYPDRNWLSIAVDCGYYDYQHMVRDFQDFADQTPPQAFALQSTAPERLLGVPHEFSVTDPEGLHFEATSS